MMNIKKMFKNISITLLIFLLSKSLFSKPINFEGLSKFNLNDIQSITSLDIFEKITKLVISI